MLAVINRYLPWKYVRVRKYSAPWVSSEYLSLVDRREHCAQLYRKFPCRYHLELKKQARPERNHMRDSLKCDYLWQKLWNTIWEFWPGSTGKVNQINRIENNCTSNQIAESIDSYFSNVANKVLETIDDNINISKFPTFPINTLLHLNYKR